MSQIQFVLGDKLPTSYDAVVSIFSICSKPTSQLMIDVINRYEAALRTMWERSFEPKHVMTRLTVQRKIMKIVKDYYNQVYSKAHRKSKKKKNAGEAKEEPKELMSQHLYSVGVLASRAQYFYERLSIRPSIRYWIAKINENQ